MTAEPHPIRIERVAESRAGGLDLASIPFSSVFSDHMLVAEFADGRWGEPVIQPYGAFLLPPNISALQYGISVFEGLKANRGPEGEVFLFRPRENAARLNRSAARLALPEVPEAMFLHGLRELIRIDQAWIPAGDAGSLYVRPCVFSIDESVRVKPAERCLFIIFTFPFGSYYSAPVDVLVTEQYVRAFAGGTGAVKPAGNYAPALIADREAQAAGCGTVMWLDGQEHRYVEECGVMNVFFVIEDGAARRVITPELSGTILPGVTRDSVLTLLCDMKVLAEERKIAIDEVVELHRAGRLMECFGTGTAATLSHIQRIRYRGEDLVLPAVEARTIGPAVRERLVAVATGRAPDTHGWLDRI